MSLNLQCRCYDYFTGPKDEGAIHVHRHRLVVCDLSKIIGFVLYGRIQRYIAVEQRFGVNLHSSSQLSLVVQRKNLTSNSLGLGVTTIGYRSSKDLKRHHNYFHISGRRLSVPCE
jgi:hypothetical protein